MKRLIAIWLVALTVSQSAYATQMSLTGAGPIQPKASGGGGPSVTIDAVGTTNGGSGVSFTYIGITVGSGLTHSALVFVFTVVGGGTISAVSAEWDSAVGGTHQAMTQIGTANGGSSDAVYIFGLRNPTAGNKNLKVDWTTSSQIIGNAISFSGVDQSSDAAAFPHFNSATGAAPISVSITSAVGDYVVAGFGSQANFTSVNNTQLYLDNTGASWASAGNYAVGAASVTMTGNPGSGSNSVVAGCSVHAG